MRGLEEARTLAQAAAGTPALVEVPTPALEAGPMPVLAEAAMPAHPFQGNHQPTRGTGLIRAVSTGSATVGGAPPKDRAEHAAFVLAFQRAVALEVAMKRLELIFTGERRPPETKSPAAR